MSIITFESYCLMKPLGYVCIDIFRFPDMCFWRMDDVFCTRFCYSLSSLPQMKHSLCLLNRGGVMVHWFLITLQYFNNWVRDVTGPRQTSEKEGLSINYRKLKHQWHKTIRGSWYDCRGAAPWLLFASCGLWYNHLQKYLHTTASIKEKINFSCGFELWHVDKKCFTEDLLLSAGNACKWNRVCLRYYGRQTTVYFVTIHKEPYNKINSEKRPDELRPCGWACESERQGVDSLWGRSWFLTQGVTAVSCSSQTRHSLHTCNIAHANHTWVNGHIES